MGQVKRVDFCERLCSLAKEISVRLRAVANAAKACVAFECILKGKMMKKLIAGNWKMNTTREQGLELVSSIIEKIQANPSLKDSCDFLVCPPFVYLPNIKGIASGAQDCSPHEAGAYTGDISAAMIKDCGGSYVILGHSERRQYHGETSQTVASKAKAAHGAGLITIICIGESENQREQGQEQKVVGDQLVKSLPETANAQNTVIAYEPVWAIGTGKTASSEDVAAMHSFIRTKLKESLDDSDKVRILYGGSMKPENAGELLATPNVDGGLIGGASLNANAFVEIGLAARAI